MIYRDFYVQKSRLQNQSCQKIKDAKNQLHQQTESQMCDSDEERT